MTGVNEEAVTMKTASQAHHTTACMCHCFATSHTPETLYAIPPPRTPLVLIESHQIRGGLKRINEFIEGNSHGK